MSNQKQSFKIFNIRYEYYEELEETLLAKVTEYQRDNDLKFLTFGILSEYSNPKFENSRNAVIIAYFEQK